MRWHKYYAHAQRERETREQTTLGVCCISTWLVRSITQGWGNRGAMSRLQALATRAHASNPWPSTLCGSPSVVPPTITVVERGRIRGGSVRRRSNAGWRGFRFPRQFSNDSDGVDARFLRKHIWQRARFDYRSKATRLYADLFFPRVGVILWYRERFFIFHVFVYPIDLSFIPVTRNATRTLCSTFVPEPAHQSPMNGRRTYSSLDTTFNSDETDIRIFRFLRFDLTSVLGARSREKEREKRSFVEHRDQVVRESDVVLAPV